MKFLTQLMIESAFWDRSFDGPTTPKVVRGPSIDQMGLLVPAFIFSSQTAGVLDQAAKTNKNIAPIRDFFAKVAHESGSDFTGADIIDYFSHHGGLQNLQTVKSTVDKFVKSPVFKDQPRDVRDLLTKTSRFFDDYVRKNYPDSPTAHEAIMPTLRALIETSFTNKVKDTYDTKLDGKLPYTPDDFDPDALELGVLSELRHGVSFLKALTIAMDRLFHDPHCYDDVDDFGETEHPPTNQVTWTGRPGIAKIG